MPNIASVLKDEIRRLAKKEIKAQVGPTQKAAAQYRRDIAKLKRMLGQQEKQFKMVHWCRQSRPMLPTINGKRPARRSRASTITSARSSKTCSDFPNSPFDIVLLLAQCTAPIP
jgi:hypothetical protein